MKIAVEGCCHGELDSIYSHIAQLEQRNNYKVDCLLICGDFQAIRNHQDLQCMAVPNKYKQLGGFYRYYTGEKKAPILTLVIGGNHEASNYLWELYHGGWLAPNIYFLGFAGCVQVNGVRIAGASGIYKDHHYRSGHYEKVPYNNNTIRSIYHIREYDIARLSHLSSPNVVLSHDWPLGIEQYGNSDDLLRRKPYFRAEVQSNTLGSPPAMQLLQKLKPTWWFSAHLHCRFEATVVHGEPSILARGKEPIKAENPDEIDIGDFDDDVEQTEAALEVDPATATSTDKELELKANPDEILLDDELEDVVVPLPKPAITNFLALDKCLPRRQFLEVVDVPIDESPDTPRLTFDPEWLAITRAFHPYLSTSPSQLRLPNQTQAEELVKREIEWVKQNVVDYELPSCQVFWPTAPGPGSEGHNRNSQPPWYTNPQTEALCDLLQLKNKINPVPEGFKPDAIADANVPAALNIEAETP